MSYVIANFFGNPALIGSLSLPAISFQLHTFPDGESLIRVEGSVKNKSIFLLTNLWHPNAKILDLVFAAETLREQGARSIILIAPYLPYMRQDTQFNAGEGITARYFAKLISNHFDGLITVDPHLHRVHQLSEIYSIPTKVVHAAPSISQWVKDHISNPIIIGPDSESEQWIKTLGQPYTVLHKNRKGDTNVEIIIPEKDKWENKTPVLVDDIISSGHTLIETCKLLKDPPVIIGIHGIFANNAYPVLLSFAKAVYTTNTIQHESNQLDIAPSIMQAIEDWMKK